MYNFDELKLAVIGLGYVGLPLALSFGNKIATVGFDVDSSRIEKLKKGVDITGEHEAAEIFASSKLTLTNKIDDLKDCQIYVVTVPTPIDINNKPDLSAIIDVSERIGELLSAGDIVIYESTVYPGATEEICAPILEAKSGLEYASQTQNGKVFYLGYSPERINPGDKKRKLENIVKITSASTPEVAEYVDQLYRLIVTAGTHKAGSIRIAEAAKVIENTQRDVNIALINELAILFDKLGLDTEEVLSAAKTKWNFLDFSPGLVGGHCIGVDPYYLTHKAQNIGYSPEIILAGRRINDAMSKFAADKIMKLMVSNFIELEGARVLVLGITFKENCSDTRNSKVFDLIRVLNDNKCSVDVWDPRVSQYMSIDTIPADFLEYPHPNFYDCIVLAVSHSEFLDLGSKQIRKFGKDGHVFFDLKYCFSSEETDMRL